MALKNKENIFFLFFFVSFFLSIANNFYQIKKFDNYSSYTSSEGAHHMITNDIEVFWREGDQIAKDIKNGKNYFETGGEYRRPYMPSRIFAFFSLITSENLLDENKKISLENKKIIILIIQSLIYYFILFFLYKKILFLFPDVVAKCTIFFLAFEPTIFMYHSSFLSESLFFSIQLCVIFFIIKKDQTKLSLLMFGLLLGLLYLQRSVAIFYTVPVLIYYYINNKENFLKFLTCISSGFIIVLLLIGYHNYKRSGIFYVISTQAKDGFHMYLLPEILAEKKKIKYAEAKKELTNDLEKFVLEKKLNLNVAINLKPDNEKDRRTFYDYQKKIAINMMIKNPLITLKVIVKRTLSFVLIDPVAHVYYFHNWNIDDGPYYKSEQHKMWLLPRICYSLIIYFFCFIGAISVYKNEKHRSFLYYILLSILYFIAVQSWFGSTRYFSPIIIYLSFLFSFGILNFKKIIEKNLYKY